MFCGKCGNSVPEGSRFCAKCGNTMAAAAPFVPPPNDEENKKKGGAGFFSSPAGIALVVILAVAVIAGITFGIIFLVRGNSNNTVDAETVKVWDEYESILDGDGTDLAQIQINTDPNAQAQTQAGLKDAQAGLKKTQERIDALEKVLKNNGGTNARRASTRKSDNIRDIKADEMAAALAAYNAYVKKMNEFFGALIGANLLNQNVINLLNSILKELQTLAAEVKDLSNKFLKDNTKVTVVKFDPPILKMASVVAPQVEKSVQAAQAAEKARIESEAAAAAASAAAAEAAAQQQAAAAAAAAAEAAAQEAAQQTQPEEWNCGDPTCPI